MPAEASLGLTDRETHARRILEVLAAAPSGEMTSRQLMDALDSKYGHLLTKSDLLLQKQSDRARVQPKWETRAGKTKSWMIEHGYIEASPPKIWRLPVGEPMETKAPKGKMSTTSVGARTLTIGEIPGYSAPAEFGTRRAAYESGVHRVPRGRISGGAQGVDAIYMSELYADDVFTPELITYTGGGGMKNDEWVADQELTRGNLGLARAKDDAAPVRVLIRKSILTGKLSDKGYVYVGLYVVTHWDWIEKEEQYKVLMFTLEPLPGVAEEIRARYFIDSRSSVPPRVPVTINRILRDFELVRKVKALYGDTCQICETKLVTATGPYSEAAHIKPLGAPHHGADLLSNLLCLCPNCHKRFDGYGLTVDEHLNVYDLGKKIGLLSLHKQHTVDRSNLLYQFEMAAISQK